MLVKKGKAPQDSGNDLLDALKEYDQQRTGRMKKDKRQEKLGKLFGWVQFAPGWGRNALIAAVVILAALVADGIRREMGEFNATVAGFQGEVSVLKGGTTPSAPTANMALENGDIIRTGATGAATLVFPDGSSVQVEPGTEFEVRLLDYARGGERDRSFMVRSGSVIANVSKFFGTKSQATVCTPTAVAAVRGTGFRVVYDPKKAQTYVQVAEGAVAVRTPATPAPLTTSPGQMVTAEGYQLGGARGLPQGRLQAVNGEIGRLTAEYEKAPGFLERTEMALNAFLDPFLQILGLAPGSWSYATNNFARKAACQEALRRLRIHLEENNSGSELPNYLNPVTLAELQQDPREVKKILDAFGGNMLESYQKTGGSTYVVHARARNRGRTLYRMDNASITEVKE